MLILYSFKRKLMRLSMYFNNVFTGNLLKLLLILCFCLILFPSIILAGEFTAFGPQNYFRESGAPENVMREFTIFNQNAEFFLRIYNGGLEDIEAELVSSSNIKINGAKVLDSNELNQNVTFIEVPVTLELANTIEVEVKGKPGGLLTVYIIGIDNVVPDIEIVKPQSGVLTNTNPYEIGLHINDDISGINPDSCRILINGIDKTNMFSINSSGLSASFWGTILLQEGTNVINASIEDFAGNPSSTSRAFTVDITPPEISNLSPLPDTFLTNIRPIISADFNDNLSGIDTETATITLDGTDITASATITATGFSYIPNSDLADGIHSVTVDVADKAGNSATQVSWSFVTDIIPPQVTIDAVTTPTTSDRQIISGTSR